MSTKRSLLSVSDRGGLIDLANALLRHGYELVSTGGTGKHLADAGLPVTQVSDLTGFPEVFDGRVKTLHPALFGGVLYDRSVPRHVEQAEGFRREDAAMASNQLPGLVDQHRHGPAPFADGGGDLLDLVRAVGARIAGVGQQRGHRAPLDGIGRPGSLHA